MSPVKVELRLPGLSIGTDDVRTIFKRKSKVSGPCLIINRSCGLAIDTAFGSDLGAAPHMWTPHGLQHQMWELRPSGIAGQTLIVSVANGLALDATVPTTGDVKPVMWEINREPWQRWRLEDSPDGIGYLIRSAHSQRYLTLSGAAERRWQPWFEDRHAQRSQQWLLGLPFGRGAGVR
ncbi:RICIN domain-containing protein [Amycolatopsis sp. NBC_00438]|uniref:RICIN domain-containing protein n=1 Tax=Amycolatopsis sp. NBC_00438 TaxID=2903558 RepID=UPI003FA430E9